MVTIGAATLALGSGSAQAADMSQLGGIPVLLNLVILAGACACLAIAIRLFTLVKGGALARGWQMFVISFIMLVVAQIFILAEKLDFFALTFDIAGVFYLLTVILWFVGLLQTRKVLG